MQVSFWRPFVKCAWNSFNEWIAIRANAVFATMGFFWFCLILTNIPLVFPVTLPYVQYISSGVLQLIALPLLGVGTILAAKSSDQLAKEQHQAILESHDEIKKLLREDSNIENSIEKIEQHLSDPSMERALRDAHNAALDKIIRIIKDMPTPYPRSLTLTEAIRRQTDKYIEQIEAIKCS